MDLVEDLLHRAPVEEPVLPGDLGAGAAVGEADVGREVVALAVVGLDPLDPERERLGAWRFHHRLAAAEVKSTIEPVPIHHRAT